MKWKEVLSIGKGGPGIVFALVGAAIAIYGITRDISVSVTPGKSDSNAVVG